MSASERPVALRRLDLVADDARLLRGCPSTPRTVGFSPGRGAR